MAFLHGVETITLKKGIRSIQAVPSSIIILTGIAPTGAKNVPTIVANTSDAAEFGSRIPGFSIPEALDSIFAQGSGVVIVINTFDETANGAAVANEVVTITGTKFKLAFPPVGATRPVVKDAATMAITYVEGTQYTIDDFGNGVVIDTTAISAGTIKVSYKKLDATTVNAAQINGAVDGTTQARTGMKLIDNIFSLFGFKPKLIICPGYSHVPAVSAAMLGYANAYRGECLLDAPTGTTYAQAITGRGISGTFGWNTNSSRNVLLFPRWKKGNPDPASASDSTILEWYSALMAGVIAASDKANGYWESPSNKDILGVVEPEIVITCSLTDSTAQNQLLNAAGIVTYFNSFGTGLKTWGNRSAQFPSDTGAENFICVQRTKDVLEDSIEAAMLPFIDKPINQGSIDSVRQTVNGFMQGLVQKGALIDGTCTFDTTLNSVEELALGHVVYSLNFMSPTPMERITFNSTLDITLLSKLLAV